MGNIGSYGAKSLDTLALVAVANGMTLTQRQLTDVRKNCTIGSLGQKRMSFNISRLSFQKAMARANVSQTTNDWDIIEQLYTLWDQDGEERLDFREFLAGISPLACAGNTLPEILHFAMKMYDVQQTKRTNRTGLEIVLSGINATAAYFGDRVLSKEQVEVICDHVFLSLENDDLSHQACARTLSTHPIVEHFVLGKGPYKYFPADHSMQKDQSHLGGVIVDRNANRMITSAEIDSSSDYDENNEI
jgi:Ca2+-binding EF-hand superfamily protein